MAAIRLSRALGADRPRRRWSDRRSAPLMRRRYRCPRLRAVASARHLPAGLHVVSANVHDRRHRHRRPRTRSASTCRSGVEARWQAHQPAERSGDGDALQRHRRAAAVVHPACAHCPGTLAGAVRRAHLAAERARRELIDSNRGLILSVVNRYRGVVRAESSTLDMSDLDHRRRAPAAQRRRSSLHRSHGHAGPRRRLVEARAAGGRQRHAQRDRSRHRCVGGVPPAARLVPGASRRPRPGRATIVAQRMAFAAGVTRLMGHARLHDRFAGIAALELMLRRR